MRPSVVRNQREEQSGVERGEPVLFSSVFSTGGVRVERAGGGRRVTPGALAGAIVGECATAFLNARPFSRVG